ncbi:MAG: DUF2207 domain-containing protein [Chloroflexi bacterium]|nr:DUF2207 domain-containing protein [Chloroflexota bacterium]
MITTPPTLVCRATRPRTMPLAAIVAAFAVAAALFPRLASAQEEMRLFKAEYDIQADGSIVVNEEIVWDFGSEPGKHGIFRDLVTRQGCGDRPAASKATQEARMYPCPSGSDREYDITVQSVQAPAGEPIPYDISGNGDGIRITIGDANKTVTGEQTYEVRYTLKNALDAYPSHDELYWNALGTWTVPIDDVSIAVRLPAAAETQATCFQGYKSTAPCKLDPATSDPTVFRSTRVIYPNEELTIVLGWPTGIVAVPPPIVTDRVSVDDFFALDAIEFGSMAAVAIAPAAAIVALWWRTGRDRRYRTLYYLTNDPTQQTKPLFGRTDVVVEFLPPDDLRPAEMGVILDERADTLDVTATIVDLAVRGYIHITEIPKQGVFGKKDWELAKLKEPDGLLPFEGNLFRALFKGSKDKVEISDLRNTFASDLSAVKKSLYVDAVGRKWFSKSPESQRGLALLSATLVIFVGVGATVLTAIVFGRALIGVPVILAGIVLLPLSRAMARRTATGSEALRRVLGFRLYIATAETRPQEFNEQQNIFARYLPYAIVFGCVDKWAKAFKSLEAQAEASTGGWYTGIGAFQAVAFSEGLRGFSSSVGATIASSPSSGGSGFSGGFSGGGGGGGGGSW